MGSNNSIGVFPYIPFVLERIHRPPCVLFFIVDYYCQRHPLSPINHHYTVTSISNGGSDTQNIPLQCNNRGFSRNKAYFLSSNENSFFFFFFYLKVRFDRNYSKNKLPQILNEGVKMKFFLFELRKVSRQKP